MRTAYAIQDDTLLVFPSQEGRNAYCFRATFERTNARRITSSEARRLYGRTPSHDTCRANMTSDPCCNFHVLPIPAMEC